MLITFVLSALLSIGLEQTAQPRATKDNRAPQQNQPAQEQPKPAPDNRGTDQQPLVVRVPRTQAEADRDQEDRDRDTRDKNITLGLASVAGLVAALQWWVTRKQAAIAREQNRIIRRQNRIMRRQASAADKQTAHMEAGLAEARKATEAASLSADAATRGVKVAADTLDRSIAHTRAIERAYVTMTTPNGLRVSTGHVHGLPRTCFLEVLIKNHGNTPATVVGTLVKCIIINEHELPNIPDYGHDIANSGSIKTFLVKNEEYRSFIQVTFPNEDLEPLIDVQNFASDKALWVYGYVDYVDAFEIRRRAGWARKLSKWGASDWETFMDGHRYIRYPLGFDIEANHYNYDREIGQQDSHTN